MQWSPDTLPKDRLRGKWHSGFETRDLVSWRAGGPLAYAYAPRDIADIATLLSLVPEDIPVIFIGNGSNILVADSGFDGVGVLMTDVVKHANRGASGESLCEYSDGLFCVYSGVSCAKAAQTALQYGLGELEFLSGIPGTIGGALTMNAGCHGSAIWTHIEKVETLDRHGNRHVRPASEFNIGYREIHWPQNGKEWFIRAYFNLPQRDPKQIRNTMQSMNAWRKSHQPLQWPSAGSVFRNPPEISAGKVIEECGLKGMRVGGAEVSTQHGNFILNVENATASDILTLIDRVQFKVQEKTGICLQLEVHVFGGVKQGE